MYHKPHIAPQIFPYNFRVFEEAHEAVVKLKTLKPFLSPQDEETLAILIDKELMNHLEKSLREANEGKIEPLQNILTLSEAKRKVPAKGEVLK